jgi:hypothetical protein
MEMVFSGEGGIEFDYEVDVREIETTRCDVCGDKNGRFFVFGVVCEGRCTDGLRERTMESICCNCMRFRR